MRNFRSWEGVPRDERGERKEGASASHARGARAVPHRVAVVGGGCAWRGRAVVGCGREGHWRGGEGRAAAVSAARTFSPRTTSRGARFVLPHKRLNAGWVP